MLPQGAEEGNWGLSRGREDRMELEKLSKAKAGPGCIPSVTQPAAKEHP